eukprot:TRINITY_DN9250_c0_g1_i3.p1 TRINITY_DN9250_c0_g1~~TRINITY_DN9250_c0_g1_i3.p1  ORF type:complete len:208 (-),score=48.71 TRINITY_DN9250_c0_g1_i3:82-705(-)
MLSSRDYDFLAKVVFCGDSGVGKTCLLRRFVKGEFDENALTTIGVDFEVTTVEVKGSTVKLQIWDTAGQERFRTVTSSYYRGSSFIAVVFDVTSEQSFSNVPSWIQEIEKKTTADIPKVLIGNKSDLALQRRVTDAQGRSLAEKLGLMYVETSAKNATNLDELFHHIAATSIPKSRAGSTEVPLLLENHLAGTNLSFSWWQGICTIL